MQFQKHNFAHNFLNAVETDKPVAWDILVNEINEIILDMPADVKAALTSSGIKVPGNPNSSDLLELVHEGIYENEKLHKEILKVIAKRHKNSHFNANAGEFDQVIGVAPTDFNMDGASVAEDENMFNFSLAGFKDLVVNAKDKVKAGIQKGKEGREARKNGNVDYSANKQITKDKAKSNLSAKQKQRNLPVSRPKGSMPSMKTFGIVLAVAAVIGTVGYLIYKSNKQQTA
jgi:hypothetical protein